MIDVIIVIVILVMVLFGYTRGLLQTILSLTSRLISLVISWMLHPFVSRIILNFKLVGFIERGVRRNFIGMAGLKSTSIVSSIKNIKLPVKLFNYIESVISTTAGNIMDNVVGQSVNVIVNIISMSIIFVLTNLMLNFIIKTVGVVSKLPVINQFNKVGGALIGFVQGALIIYLFLAVVSVFPLISNENQIQKAIEDSFIAKEMYYNNLLLELFLPKG